MRHLGVAALRGLMWLGGDKIGGRVADQVILIVLAHRLFPRDFGMFALASIFTALMHRLAAMGLGAAIVQRPRMDEEYLSTAFWGHLGAGTLLFAIVALLSGPVGVFFKEPGLSPVVLVMASQCIIAAGSATPLALIVRRMDYRSLALRSTAGTVAGGAVGVGMAYAGLGVWSLVGLTLAKVATQTVLLYRVAGWKPRFVFSWLKFRDLWSFSAPVGLSGLCVDLFRNADNVLIGRYLGSTALGFYALGYTVFLAPFGDARLIIDKVIFPAISRLRHDDQSFRYSFLLATKYITFVALPAVVGLSLISPLFVSVVFGMKWLPAAPVISILALAGLLELMTIVTPSGLQAAGRPDLDLWSSALAVLLYVPAFWIGLRGGIVGVALGYLAATALFVPVQFGLAARVVGVTVAQMWSAISPSVIGCLAMTAGILCAWWALDAVRTPRAIALGVLVLAGAVVYGGSVWAVHRQGVLELLSLVRRSLSIGSALRFGEAADASPP